MAARSGTRLARRRQDADHLLHVAGRDLRLPTCDGRAPAPQARARLPLPVPGQQHMVVGQGRGSRVVIATMRTDFPGAISAVGVTTTTGRTLRKPFASSSSAQATLPRPARGSGSRRRFLLRLEGLSSSSSNQDCGGRRLPLPAPINLCRRPLDFLTCQDFPDQLQLLQWDDGREVLAVPAHDHRPARGGDLAEHSAYPCVPLLGTRRTESRHRIVNELRDRASQVAAGTMRSMKPCSRNSLVWNRRAARCGSWP